MNMSIEKNAKAMAGKVAVVTGAGRGIGREIALQLAAAGAKVVVNDAGVSVTGESGGENPADEVVAAIRQQGGQAVAVTDSVADLKGAEKIVQAALDSFGRVDTVVNNAGILRDRIFFNMSPEEWDAVLKVHLYGSFYVSRFAAPHMKKQAGGTFVNMTSTTGLIGNYGQANYAAAKMGILGLSKSIALDLARYNVRSNCISPFAWSRMGGAIPDTPEQQERLAKLRNMTADKIAVVATFLASPLSGDMTGQVLAVRRNEIFLMSQPRPLRSVHRSEGWTLDSLAEQMVPALRPSFVPMDRTENVFSWDPI